MITILGAGGTIGNDLARELAALGEKVRLVSRHPKPVDGAAETMAADLSDLRQTVDAVAGSEVVHLLVGLKYDIREWTALWPRVMDNVIEACQRSGAKLAFFDNVYMYGRVDGPMTEETPFRPSSRKGEVRARIATTLLEQIKAGNLTALIARSADFYGPGARNSVANLLVFEKLAQGGRAMWLVNDSVPHSYTFTPDAAKALVLLTRSETAWNQTWHLPTAPLPPTGKELIAMAAVEFSVKPRHWVLNRPMLRMYGWFDRTVAESYEMLYQNDSPYVFDSTKFLRAFAIEATPYADGVRITATAYKTQPA